MTCFRQILEKVQIHIAFVIFIFDPCTLNLALRLGQSRANAPKAISSGYCYSIASWAALKHSASIESALKLRYPPRVIKWYDKWKFFSTEVPQNSAPVVDFRVSHLCPISHMHNKYYETLWPSIILCTIFIQWDCGNMHTELQVNRRWSWPPK